MWLPPLRSKSRKKMRTRGLHPIHGCEPISLLFRRSEMLLTKSSGIDSSGLNIRRQSRELARVAFVSSEKSTGVKKTSSQKRLHKNTMKKLASRKTGSRLFSPFFRHDRNQPFSGFRRKFNLNNANWYITFETRSRSFQPITTFSNLVCLLPLFPLWNYEHKHTSLD